MLLPLLASLSSNKKYISVACDILELPGGVSDNDGYYPGIFSGTERIA